MSFGLSLSAPGRDVCLPSYRHWSTVACAWHGWTSPRPHRQPSGPRVAVALVLSVAGSLAADALLVALGEAVFPSTKGFGHFQFSDYAKLTVIGVVIACLAWPVVTRISSAPRWLFLRLAIAVTLVLWLPDLYILYQGERPKRSRC